MKTAKHVVVENCENKADARAQARTLTQREPRKAVKAGGGKYRVYFA